MGGGTTHEGGDAVLVTASGVAAVDGDPVDAAAAVGVTYHFNAETWLDRWGADRERAVAVSAGEQSRSAAAVTGSAAAPDGAGVPGSDPVQVEAGVVETVPSAGDVGAVGAAVHDYLEAWGEHAPTVYVDTLADVVDATDAELAFRFLHVLVSRAEDADARVVASVGEGLPAHVVETFAPLFDRVV